MRAAALTACNMGIADRLAESGMTDIDFGGSTVVSTLSFGVVVVESVAVLAVSERFGFERVLRSVGVSNDSRALGSSNLVYLPIDGLWIT